MTTSAEETRDYMVKVFCEDLRLGMYVQELDRPWVETPFMFQGFLLGSEREIDALKKYCKFVYVNKVESSIDVSIKHARIERDDGSESDVRKIAQEPVSRVHYENTVPVEEELSIAKEIYEDGYSIMSDIYAGAIKNGNLDIPNVKQTTTAIVGSVLRNPDAIMLLQHIKERSEYRYSHAVNCCSLAAVLCRHLGYSKQEIHDISMGALLLDIGTIRLPRELLEKSGKLNALSLRLVEHHVGFGLNILNGSENVSQTVIDMVKSHHERVNGTGYPNQLKGDEIPMSGRIASIVDSYDAMVSKRPHRKRMSPTEAICDMYNSRNILFHEELIEQFIQCIGAYPTGSLVRLSSGQVAIVMSQNRIRRLYPKILMVQDDNGVNYDTPFMLDLWEHAEKSVNDPLDIVKVIDAADIDIDPSEYYL
ncbi:MAG: HD-GYP domain-containing protein [Gammaproteobacteria bacterium]|nr:HD-GYP domain-containing protein [Gammaproteobacteria bacterium]